MPLDATKRAEYQRAYRERQKAPVVAEGSLGAIAAVQGVRRVHRDDHGEVLEHRLARQRTGKTQLNPFTDGLPDWGDLIQGMTQAQRDHILSRMPKTGRYRDMTSPGPIAPLDGS